MKPRIFVLLVLLGVGIINQTAWTHPLGAGVMYAQCLEPQGEPLVLTVNGGRDYAEPGEVFGFDIENFNVDPCQPVEVTFINHDPIRHAFMVDYLSPMFMIELPAEGQATMSFIAPEEDATLLLHCHIPGHDRAGMLGQVIVGKGDVHNPLENPILLWYISAATLGLIGGLALGWLS
jgi:hypothetical protein